MMRDYADAAGGSIRLESAVGEGTTVCLTLPTAEPEGGDLNAIPRHANEVGNVPELVAVS